jgi:adenylylsulfate kinase-like enzyme
VVWLTGNAGAGKTTLARFLKEEFSGRAVVLDGNEMRTSISTDCGFSPEDRREHNLRVARLADILAHQGFLVVVAVIAPFARVRKEIDAICRPLWVYVKRDGSTSPDHPYEPPPKPDLLIDTRILSLAQARRRLCTFLDRRAA